ncbi:MAG: hypothetical protein IPK32_16475 [Verrucomicrobiaceae bacterium]|nr:hypothetical protein [Verrucomicrobiaceae bacterium]
MNPRTIRKLHRWLGLFFSISVLMAAGSGVIHNVMTRTQAPPPQAKPSGGGMDVNAIRISVAEATAKLSNPAPTVQAVNLRGIGGQPWYQIYTPESKTPHYVSAVDGRVDAAQDEAYAAEIARGFLAGSEVKKPTTSPPSTPSTSTSSASCPCIALIPATLSTPASMSAPPPAASHATPIASASSKPPSSRTSTSSASSVTKTPVTSSSPCSPQAPQSSRCLASRSFSSRVRAHADESGAKCRPPLSWTCRTFFERGIWPAKAVMIAP